MDVANGVFPNKEAILRAMGFSEFPTRVDVLQLLYYICLLYTSPSPRD